jgi:DNA-binding winged helix-turn-helix (wHTH) protein
MIEKKLKNASSAVLSYFGDTLTRINAHHLILLVLLGVCTLFYYFGELVDLAGWEALRWEVFYTVHDIHRLLFFVPVIYASYFFGVRWAIIVTVVSLAVFLPRAILISSYPDAIPRAVFEAIIAGVAGSLVAVAHHKYQRLRHVKTLPGNEGAILAGTPNRSGDGVFTLGDLEIDFSKRVVKLRRQIVKLTPREYMLLSYFVRNNGKVISHKNLLCDVWGPEYDDAIEILRTFVRQLRCKIEDDPSHPRFIITEQGVGYRFVESEEHPR